MKLDKLGFRAYSEKEREKERDVPEDSGYLISRTVEAFLQN